MRKADAYLHTMHYEGAQTRSRVELERVNPWGIPGEDYSASYPVITEPLYRRTPEDRNTLLDAADFLDEFVMDEDDEADVLAKQLREMAGD